jgi:DNA mismatch repair ATPase MutL
LEAAVADLVDNSILAKAKTVEVTTEWAGDASWPAVSDHGEGTDDSTLITAMTIAGRGPSAEREKGTSNVLHSV